METKCLIPKTVKPLVGTNNIIQPKLEVNPPNDEYEQEADKIADRVSRMSINAADPPMQPKEKGSIKMQPTIRESKLQMRPKNESSLTMKPEEETSGKIQMSSRNASGQKVPQVSSEMTSLVNATKGHGRPLSEGVSQEMGQIIGGDFSNVRIHTDSYAVQMNREIGAKAFTHGNDIYFNNSNYNPDNLSGKHLLAHELTHTIQESQSNKIHRSEEDDDFNPLEVSATDIQELREYGLSIAKKCKTGLPVLTISKGIAHFYDIEGKEIGVYPMKGNFSFNTGVFIGGTDGIWRLGENKTKKQIQYGDLDLEKFSEEALERLATQNALLFSDWIEMDESKAPALPIVIIVAPVTVSEGAGNGLEGEGLGKSGQGGGSDEKETVAPPGWLVDKKKALLALIKTAREQKSIPKDLPDHIQEWYKEETQNWYLNVWVYFDSNAKTKFVKSILLIEEESADELFVRVREATTKALLEFNGTNQYGIKKEIPKWAVALKKNVEKELEEIRKKEPDATNIPDGVDLASENITTNQDQSSDLQEEKKASKYFFNIWVKRGKTSIEQKTGTVPWPLNPKTTVLEIIPKIRQLAAVLKQFETDLPKKGNTKTFDTVPPTDEYALSAFPAKIVPVDLSADNITVTGAKNNFIMSLDYEAVYGGGELKDLYIASKLYQQSILFNWKLYKVPIKIDVKGEEKENESWENKWLQLYNLYNPSPIIDNEDNAESEPPPPLPDSLLNEIETYDSNVEITLPEEGGDYLVYCITAHSPIGEYQLKRISSYAYYPIRLKPIKQVAAQSASKRSSAISSAEIEISELKEICSDTSLNENQKQIFQSVLIEESAYIERAKAKESGTLPSNLEAEIIYISDTIGKLSKLDSLLPKILDKASKEGLLPSQLLKEKDSTLLDLYWYLIYKKISVTDYKIYLENQFIQLKKQKERSSEFNNEIKFGSPYQYSPEAAMVSKVTGLAYPLVLMVGESPDSTGEKIVYSVVDITSKETQEVYKGVSTKRGAEGHKEAIDNAFAEFGSDAKYGEGIIAVRFSSGKAGADNPNHPGFDILYYNSEEGILQKVLWALGIIGAIAGVAALTATGVGAPVAATCLGLVAGVAGAVVAVHNINERKKQHTFEWDAEMALDIISIVSVIPALSSLKLAKLSKTVAGFNEYRLLGNLVQIYGLSEMGATALLLPTKLYQDFEKIDKDVEKGDLTPDQAKAIKSQLILGAMQTAIMMIGSAAATHYGTKTGEGSMSFKSRESLDQQAKFIELEGYGKQYKSLEDLGWVDSNGVWTDKGIEKSKPTLSSAEVEVNPPVSGEKVSTVPKDIMPEEITPKGTVKHEIEEPVVIEKKIPVKTDEDIPSKPSPEEVAIPKKTTVSKGNTNITEETSGNNIKTGEPAEGEIIKLSETLEPKLNKVDSGTEPTIEESIQTAEAAVKKYQEELTYWEAEVAAKKAKVALAKKGKSELTEAQQLLKETEEICELARRDKIIAEEQASQLRQKKLSAEVDAAKTAEQPLLTSIQEKKEILARISEKKKEILDERDRIRDWIRDESIIKTQEQVQSKVKKLEQLNSKFKKVEVTEKTIKSELLQAYEELFPLQAKTRQKLEALQAEQRAAIGITPQEYKWLRSGSPSKAIQKKIQESKRDAIYDMPIVGTPVADHIVSMHEITQMTGFSKLSKKQKLQILNLEENFMPLDSRVNSSKGDRSFSEWDGHPQFGKIPPETKVNLMQKEAELRTRLQQEIDLLVPKP